MSEKKEKVNYSFRLDKKKTKKFFLIHLFCREIERKRGEGKEIRGTRSDAENIIKEILQREFLVFCFWRSAKAFSILL